MLDAESAAAAGRSRDGPNDIPAAERLFKAHLKRVPTDVPAIRMLAEVAVRCGQDADAEKLLMRCLELAPTFAAARYNYAVLLHRLNKAAEALVEIERLLAVDPRNPGYRNLHAVILSRIGEYERSSRIYAELLTEYPANAKVWLSYGHVLKTEGRQDEGIDAYRKSIAHDPAFGEAYWSLANLKTFRFDEADLSAMHAQLAAPASMTRAASSSILRSEKRTRTPATTRGPSNIMRKAMRWSAPRSRYDADLNATRIQRLKTAFTRDFFGDRAGSGCEARRPDLRRQPAACGFDAARADPVQPFGRWRARWNCPRSITMAKDLREQAEPDEIATYAEVLASRSATELRELGEQYIERTRIHRKIGSTVLHRQDAQQLPAHRADPAWSCRTRKSSMRAGIRWPAVSRTSSSTTRAASASVTASKTWAASTATMSN